MSRRSRRQRRAERLRDATVAPPKATYHTNFGLPPDLGTDKDHRIPEYDPPDGGVIRTQRELFATQLAGVIRAGIVRGLGAFAAPGLGKTDLTRKVAYLCHCMPVFAKPTAAALYQLAWDYRHHPRVLMILDDALHALHREDLVTVLLDMLPVGGGPGIIRVTTREAIKNAQKGAAGDAGYNPDIPDIEFETHLKVAILANHNVFDANIQKANPRLASVLSALESRIGPPVRWSFDPLQRLYYILWFAHQGAILRRWHPDINLRMQNEVLERFIETAPFRVDLSLRGLQMLSNRRIVHPNNWRRMDDETLDREPAHRMEGTGRGKMPIVIPDWIWQRRGEYLVRASALPLPPAADEVTSPQPDKPKVEQSDGAAPQQAPQTQDKRIDLTPPPVQRPWTVIIVRIRGSEYRIGMSQHAFDEHARTEDWKEAVTQAVAVMRSEGGFPSGEKYAALRLLAVANHKGAIIDRNALFNAGITELHLDPAPNTSRKEEASPETEGTSAKTGEQATLLTTQPLLLITITRTGRGTHPLKATVDSLTWEKVRNEAKDAPSDRALAHATRHLDEGDSTQREQAVITLAAYYRADRLREQDMEKGRISDITIAEYLPPSTPTRRDAMNAEIMEKLRERQKQVGTEERGPAQATESHDKGGP